MSMSKMVLVGVLSGFLFAGCAGGVTASPTSAPTTSVPTTATSSPSATPTSVVEPTRTVDPGETAVAYLMKHANGDWSSKQKMVEACTQAFGTPDEVMGAALSTGSDSEVHPYGGKVDSTGTGNSSCIFTDSSGEQVWIEVKSRKSVATNAYKANGCRTYDIMGDQTDVFSECRTNSKWRISYRITWNDTTVLSDEHVALTLTIAKRYRAAYQVVMES